MCHSAWQSNSHPHQPGICSSTSPGTVNQAGFNGSYSEGLPPGLSGNIYGSVSNLRFMIDNTIFMVVATALAMLRHVDRLCTGNIVLRVPGNCYYYF